MVNWGYITVLLITHYLPVRPAAINVLYMSRFVPIIRTIDHIKYRKIIVTQEIIYSYH